LIPLIGRGEERFAELPRVGRTAERELLVAPFIKDIDMPLDSAFTRLRPPNLDHKVWGCTGRLCGQ
jgi:hypothetical protein